MKHEDAAAHNHQTGGPLITSNRKQTTGFEKKKMSALTKVKIA